MLYVAICKDDPAHGLSRRKMARPSHLAHLERAGDKLRVGGALMSEDGAEPRGSLLVIEAESLEEARALLADDPYTHAGVFASVEVYPLKQAAGVVALG